MSHHPFTFPSPKNKEKFDALSWALTELRFAVKDSLRAEKIAEARRIAQTTRRLYAAFWKRGRRAGPRVGRAL